MIRAAVLFLILVAAAGLSLDCRKKKSARVEATGSAMAAAERPGATTMAETKSRIADTLLARCIESKGVVVLVQIDRAEIRSPGTRGESASFQATVKRSVYGTPKQSVEFWCYTSSGDTVLLAGKTYLVAISGSGEGFVPGTMMGHVPVAPGEEDATVTTHEEAVHRLSASP